MSTAPQSDSSPPRRSFPWDYFTLAFAFSWAFWGLAYVAARNRPPVTTEGTEALLEAASPAMLVLILVGVFGPFFSAFVLTGRRDGREGVSALWRSGWRFKLPLPWLLIALLLFPAMRIASLLVSGAGVSFELFARPLALIGLTLFMYFLGGSFGEEFGWRGYALPRLLERHTALGASLILGLLWVAWHLPLFFIPGSPQSRIPFTPWALGVVLMAILYTWVHVHVGGAVFAALLLHTTGNLSGDLFVPVRDVASTWRSPDAWNLYFGGVLALLVLIVWGPKTLRRDKA